MNTTVVEVQPAAELEKDIPKRPQPRVQEKIEARDNRRVRWPVCLFLRLHVFHSWWNNVFHLFPGGDGSTIPL